MMPKFQRKKNNNNIREIAQRHCKVKLKLTRNQKPEVGTSEHARIIAECRIGVCRINEVILLRGLLNSIDDIIEALDYLVGSFPLILSLGERPFFHNALVSKNAHASKKQLIFGRDFIGRRSLLWGHSPNYPFIISSLAFDVDSIMNICNSFGFLIWDCKCFWSSGEIAHRHEDLAISKITLDSTISDARLIDLGYDGEKKIPLPSLQEVKELCEILSQAVKVRVDNQPECCKDCFQSKSCFHSSVSILYSGGLDSSVIAILADRHVSNDQPIDLLNVAFEHTQGGKSTFLSPDRKAALEGVEELRRIAPTRKWNLIEVNVTKDEVDKFRDKYIKELLYPNKTVLDESIGCACWFAAQGEGLLNGTSYRTPSRVILLGMGADEQLCGYTRHRVAFKNGDGWHLFKRFQKISITYLQETLEEMIGISKKKRILSDSSREPRYPFLDEDVISYLNSIPIWLKADLNLPPGIGDKILLRLVAQSLNLKKASQKAKQAIQFGSKFVKIQNPKEKGHNKSNRL
ncbi:ASNSD1 [Cordylochernes scorpioides]|uniref:ASNSD1 n=1 Tax=Cordylochernes scorpioides TaxID=51811 RepID=A0ABY6LUL6_9ARAC|nr:ASNSD1 [Cordylochernes scorpioides]